MADSGSSLVGDLGRLEVEGLRAAEAAETLGALEEVRVRFLGRREGRLSELLRRVGGLGPLGAAPRGRGRESGKGASPGGGRGPQRRLRSPARAEPRTDLTLPSRARWIGGRHPVTRVVDDLVTIFRSLGFTLVRGPEAETEWYNFEALNTPLDHPAADEQDTLYLKGATSFGATPLPSR